MNIRYRITLTAEERDQLRSFVQTGKGAFRRLKRAQILLASEAGSTDATIAHNISVGTSTVSERSDASSKKGSRPRSASCRVRALTASSRRRRKPFSSRRRARRRRPVERAGRWSFSLARWCG